MSQVQRKQNPRTAWPHPGTWIRLKPSNRISRLRPSCSVSSGEESLLDGVGHLPGRRWSAEIGPHAAVEVVNRVHNPTGEEFGLLLKRPERRLLIGRRICRAP